MGLTLLFPLGLAALAAWLLPLLIHLARRQESRLTEFAALRWLRAQPRPRQRIRVDEWPLLLLRLLLLALLALLLAGLAWRDEDARRLRVLVAPGIDAAALRALALPADAQTRWLAPGFPAFDSPMPTATQPVASLLREFDASLPAQAPLRVIVPADVGAMDAARPLLSRAVDWQVLPGHSPAVAAAPAAPLRLALIAIDPADPALRILRALHAAWQTTPTTSALPALPANAPGAPPPAVGTIAVWWRGGAVPDAWLAWVRQGGELLVAPRTPLPAGAVAQAHWRDANGDHLLDAVTHGNGTLWRLPQGLDPAAFPRVLDAGFARDLATHLRPLPPPTRAVASDFAPLQQARTWPAAAARLLPWLPLLIALLFALERWLATSPRRGAPA
ncbi:MAG TPA: BatA domain-containing protein [Stenotrophomonas sp.]|nr:BatA domain-containing protein [Stenotrophomonas sp.]